ncbi:MAG: DNA topoisomerase I [Candidatus Bathyarchaeota archaeon]|nr:MAG: DNA topoisomerase I [Candidatus Bathyarchaeota archaeon]
MERKDYPMEKHTLIIAEKPSAAQRLAEALDHEGKPEEIREKGVPYFVAHCRGKRLVVAPALGHLYTVVQTQGRRNYYPVFDFKWAPRHVAERGAKRIRIWTELLSKLAQDADHFIGACDYDLEGSLIGYCILKYVCGNKEATARRMKFSTLMKSELEKSYQKLLPRLDFALIEAGKTRHEVDWLYGMNLSRALTLAAERWSGRYATLSTGRVQGPTLRFLARRESAIRCFVPTPYWGIKATFEKYGCAYEAKYARQKIEKRIEADTVVKKCRGKIGEIEKIGVKNLRQKPPIPFDLGKLQTEAYRLFRYKPRRTARVAERLYLKTLISYPRTSSQRLPSIINYRRILKGLSKKLVYGRLASELLKKEKLKPMEGKKEDSSHPAVYPTGNLPARALSESEKKIWDLVVRRFMAVFGESAIVQSTRVCIGVNGYHFYLRGRRVMKEGWMHFYIPYTRTEELLLPSLKEGEKIKLTNITRKDKFTKPPPRYNPSTLLNKMEDEGIGTKTTRADIIETLYNRGYIADERVRATDLGITVSETLQEHCPEVVSVKLTRELEEKMEFVKSGNEKRENVLIDTVTQLRPLLEEFKRKEETIGRTLSDAIRNAQVQERVIGSCSSCSSGQLIILHSRKTGKRFIGCSNYFKGLCRASFPLPQRGTAKPLGRDCKSCRWPLMQIRMRGKRTWRLCFNPECSSKEEGRKRVEMRNL